MSLEGMTSELVERANACETPEEILALAEEEGYELDHEELESIAGGDWSPAKALPQCPACGSYAIYTNPLPGTGCASCACHDCGYQWTKTVVDPILPSHLAPSPDEK